MVDLSKNNTLPRRFSHQFNRNGATSPPLPPPPPPDQDEISNFGRLLPCSGTIRPIVPDEEDLPGWVPKNYIEKGKLNRSISLDITNICMQLVF